MIGRGTVLLGIVGLCLVRYGQVQQGWVRQGKNLFSFFHYSVTYGTRARLGKATCHIYQETPP